MIFLWKIFSEFPADLIGSYDKSQPLNRFRLLEGHKIDIELNHKIKFKFESEVSRLREWPDLANNALIPLVNQAVGKTLVKVCGEDVQLLRSEIQCSDGKIEDYVVVVATNSTKGLDLQAANYSLIPGTDAIMGVEDPVYFNDCLGSRHIARDSDYLSNLLISKELVDELNRFRKIGTLAVKSN